MKRGGLCELEVALTVLEALVLGFTPFDGLGGHVSAALGFRRGVGTARGVEGNLGLGRFLVGPPRGL